MNQAPLLEGILHIADERQDGQLRDPAQPLRPLKGGIVVPRNVIRELQLCPGLMLKGEQRGRALGKVASIEGRPHEEYAERTHLYESIALDPHPMIKLEHDPNEVTTRIMDILTPVGFGH